MLAIIRVKWMFVSKAGFTLPSEYSFSALEFI